ncbi:MAG: GTPase Era [Coriobacteriales bacterium]|jgi:GTP-binding protein Era|nr:GTPase Era [Coriobacteriales bacterium]
MTAPESGSVPEVADKALPTASPESAPLPADFKSGFIALTGRPNAGKSTLVNAVLGQKLAITSNTPQTTRHRFRAILTTRESQLILVDTPGLHKPLDALGEELNRSALKALEDVDLVAFLLDATQRFGRGDAWVLEQVKRAQAPTLLVITKAALASPEQSQCQIQAAEAAHRFVDVVVTSALEGRGVEDFVASCVALLPEGPAWFPSDAKSDQPLEVLVAEFIREKVLTSTYDELPHAVGVAVEDLSYDPRRNFYRIEAIIYVERESQKGMLVGKGGTRIKAIGSAARADLETLLGAGLYLDLRVKTRRNWRRDAHQIKRFGYGE